MSTESELIAHMRRRNDRLRAEVRDLELQIKSLSRHVRELVAELDKRSNKNESRSV